MIEPREIEKAVIASRQVTGQGLNGLVQVKQMVTLAFHLHHTLHPEKAADTRALRDRCHMM